MCDNSKAGTDGHKQNLACRHTMRRRRGVLNLVVNTGPLPQKRQRPTENHRKQEWMEDAHKDDIPSHGPHKPQSKH